MTTKVIQKTSVQNTKFHETRWETALENRGACSEMRCKKPQNGSQQKRRCCKKVFSKVILWVIPATFVKTWCETIECSQEIEEHWKSNDSQKWAKNNSQQLLWIDWKVWKQFYGFGIPWQFPSEVPARFPNKMCIILRNTEIQKQTKTYMILLSCLTEFKEGVRGWEIS